MNCIEVDALRSLWEALFNKESLLLVLSCLAPLASVRFWMDDVRILVGKDNFIYGRVRRDYLVLVATTIFGCAVMTYALTRDVQTMLFCATVGTITSYCGIKLWWNKGEGKDATKQE